MFVSPRTRTFCVYFPSQEQECGALRAKLDQLGVSVELPPEPSIPQPPPIVSALESPATHTGYRGSTRTD